MASHHTQTVHRYARTKVDLQTRIEESGWGFFLLMIGILLLLPSEFVPGGAWLVVAGIIMIALNCIRYVNNITVSRFTVVLGLVTIVAGLTELFHVTLPLLPGLLALIGLSIIVKSMLPQTNRLH
jgi:membrane-bound ClpP family serine protease